MLKVFDSIASGPIEKDIDGQMTKGFSIFTSHKWEEEFIDEDGNQSYSCVWDVEGWDIYQDGTFIYKKNSDTERAVGECQGTFDPSLYEDYVNQMREYKFDWLEGLNYDLETQDYTFG